MVKAVGKSINECDKARAKDDKSTLAATISGYAGLFGESNAFPEVVQKFLRLCRPFHGLGNVWRTQPHVPLRSKWGYRHAAVPQLKNYLAYNVGSGVIAATT